MRHKYSDCQREDGNCAVCALVSYGRDCHNRPITKLEWVRRASGMTQVELAAKTNINIRQIQRVECGESDAGNLTAKNIIALADALRVDVHDLV